MTAAPEDRLAPGQLAEAYLDALARADLAAMLVLFSEDALVHSPLYGPAPASEFYPALFSDTSQALLTLLGVTHGAKADGGWRLPSGRRAPFDVVDVLELAPMAASPRCTSSTTPRTSGLPSRTTPASCPGIRTGPAPSQPPRGRRVPGRGAPRHPGVMGSCSSVTHWSVFSGHSR